MKTTQQTLYWQRVLSQHSFIPAICFPPHALEAVFTANYQPSPSFCLRCRAWVFNCTNTGHDLHVISAKLSPSATLLHWFPSAKQRPRIFAPKFSTVNITAIFFCSFLKRQIMLCKGTLHAFLKLFYHESLQSAENLFKILTLETACKQLYTVTLGLACSPDSEHCRNTIIQNKSVYVRVCVCQIKIKSWTKVSIFKVLRMILSFSFYQYRNIFIWFSVLFHHFFFFFF